MKSLMELYGFSAYEIAEQTLHFERNEGADGYLVAVSGCFHGSKEFYFIDIVNMKPGTTEQLLTDGEQEFCAMEVYSDLKTVETLLERGAKDYRDSPDLLGNKIIRNHAEEHNAEPGLCLRAAKLRDFDDEGNLTQARTLKAINLESYAKGLIKEQL